MWIQHCQIISRKYKMKLVQIIERATSIAVVPLYLRVFINFLYEQNMSRSSTEMYKLHESSVLGMLYLCCKLQFYYYFPVLFPNLFPMCGTHCVL